MPSILRLGAQFISKRARVPRPRASRFLQRLSIQTGETANLSVLDGPDVVYLSRSNSPRIVSIGFQPGARVPAHVVSAGLRDSLELCRRSSSMRGSRRASFARFHAAHPSPMRRSFANRWAAARSLGYWRIEQFIDAGAGGNRRGAPPTARAGVRGAISITYQMQVYPADTALTKLLPALQEVATVLRAVI